MKLDKDNNVIVLHFRPWWHPAVLRLIVRGWIRR